MESAPIDQAFASDAALLSLLRAHPKVASVVETPAERGLTFRRGDVSRSISIGNAQEELKGLVELMDNNPLVCADRFSLPDPGATLALIALGPLCQAGLLLERPTFMTNAPTDEESLAPFLATTGWPEGVTLATEDLEMGGAFAATAIAAISPLQSLTEIDELYEERYGRSFFVRRDEDSPWDVALAADKPYAIYRMRIAPGEDACLLTIRALAHRNGKCGAAQVAHAMNVMAGFEETLGLEG